MRKGAVGGRVDLLQQRLTGRYKKLLISKQTNFKANHDWIKLSVFMLFLKIHYNGRGAWRSGKACDAYMVASVFDTAVPGSNPSPGSMCCMSSLSLHPTSCPLTLKK
ncbi:hypothetical protein ATANTOWER_008263 [Ataeniobius toweri]|uniref:Uncharacterized protein n=1 Tax=Ataeniobius toweri TaxID=208326 RepID=A0ABU7A9Y4_9TELE|nr:hypothetical protein [Ataeniobius toweri]